MLKAGSLYYSLIIVILVGTIIGALVLNTGTHQTFRKRSELNSELVETCTNGIKYGLAFYDELTTNKETVDIFENSKKVSLYKERWGGFNLLFCESFLKNEKIRKTAIIGNYEKNSFALYLPDLDRPLLLSGKSTIYGDCKLPNEGVSSTFIDGVNSNSSEKLVVGRVLKSEKKLPKLALDIASVFEDFHNLDYESILEKGFLKNEFNNLPVIVDMNEVIDLENIVISGKVIIQSQDSINIRKTAKLENIIIKSPKVYIENGFIGSIQIIASSDVYIDENVTLKYPSFITLENNDNTIQAKVSISPNSNILGGILLYGKTSSEYQNQLIIDENVLVAGNIYCNGETQLKGKIKGSIYTNRFFLNTDESEYNNVILNGSIDNINLPEKFVRINFIEGKEANYEIIKWL